MKRVVLTGATGFVGANLARRLLREGHDVHLFLRPGYRSWRIQDLLSETRLHILDLADFDQVHAEVTAIRPDWVFHLAVFGAYSSQTSLAQMIETNLLGTANLLNACVETGFEIFLNTGSSSEYGFKDHAPKENEWLEPNSSYAVTKAAATHYCHHIARSRNLNLATMRLYSVYGPFEEPSRLIPTIIVDGLQGRLPNLVNPGVARDYTFVEDILEAYLLAATHPEAVSGRIYNIGSGLQTTLAQVVELVFQILPVTTLPKWGSMLDRNWDTSIWVADRSQITNDLGWQPAFSFAQGFQQTVDWFLAHPKILAFYNNYREVPR